MLSIMKKVILFLVALFATGMVMAASVDSTGGVSSGKVYNDSKALFGKVMDGAGQAVETGYDVIVQQQRVVAVQYLLVFIGALICLFLFVRFYRKGSAEGEKNTLFPAIVFGVLGLWMMVVFSFHYTEVVQGLVNPDYAAIKDIVEMFKSTQAGNGVTLK